MVAHLRLAAVLAPFVATLLIVFVADAACAATSVQEATVDETAADEAADVDEAAEVEAVGQAETTEIRSEEAKLATRTSAILAAVDEFASLEATVEAGIVALSGTAPSREDVQRAVALLEQLDGVLLVIDAVEIERDLGARLNDSWRFVGDQLRAAVAALPLYFAALLIVVAFWLLARFLRDLDLLYRAASERTLLRLLLRQTVFAVVLVVGIVVALRFVDAGAVLGAILGAAGVIGIALGFAFRNIIENYLAGVLLALRQPFRARDEVDIDGQTGIVLRMTASETTLMDVGGNHVRLPNALIFNGRVLNYTRNPLRRFKVAVGVATDVDLKRAQALGLETLRGLRGVVSEPQPSACIIALGDSTVLLEFYGWVNQTESSFVKVDSEAHRRLKEAFDAAEIDMPAPEYLLRFASPAAEAVAGAATAADSAPARPRGATRKEGGDGAPVDVSPESDIDGQVAKELALSDEKDLLE